MATITGNMLADFMKSALGAPYVWGGSNPISGWDCSGAMNFDIGAHFHLAIPGFGPGQYNDTSGHGPVVGDWIQWVGVTKGVFGPVQPLPGDLIAWGPNVHMGMAVSNTRFISAANPSAGTIEADIGSFFTWAPFVLRLLQIRIGAQTVSTPNPPGPGRDDYSPTVRSTAQAIKSAGTHLNDGARSILALR